MQLNEALLLVRSKFMEERSGKTTGPSAESYKKACENYPAMMATAHWMWAHELVKDTAPR